MSVPRREFQRHYEIDGTPGWTLQAVIDELPDATYDAIGKRLRRGVRTWAELRVPSKARRRRAHTAPRPAPCALNTAFDAWRHTTRGRALQLLDVNTDPLRATL